ncbi:hypothetical protein ONE63_000572 [Megalurothrips usitatus]|uniref:DNA-directed RNA polymerase II subunit GRINL1A n=1 Tax=Megalurothrips usitatus TaxID=439358 RepID=A0AAV7Y5Z2_9NEOP|nr:hypothetical protein ONE63_000572 [Megalurothrips usitatus]
MDAENVPSAVSLDHKPERIIKKVPGSIIPIPKEKDVILEDLSKRSTADLKELLERQSRILSNKSLVNKLADKGKKATELKARIEKELKSRDEVDTTANLLSEMSLSQLNALEWTGHCNPGHRKKISPHLEDPEYEETNPLKILACHSGTTDQKIQINCKDEEIGPATKDNSKNVPLETSTNVSQEDVSVVTEENKTLPLSPAHSSLAKPFAPDEPEPFAHFICNRFGHKENKERFKPNKPLKPFTGSFPFKAPGRVSSKPKRWEETNVTPPPALHADAKLLSLEESIEIQREQNRKLKEVQMKHAAEKLASLHGIHITQEIPASVLQSMDYRGAAQANSDSEEDVNEADLEDQELHDEDQMDRGGTVVYNVES